MFLAPVVPLPVAIAASAPQVVLKDISFKPETLAVSKGTTVTWKWDDGDVPHNVTSRGKARFKSSSTKAKGTYKVRFTKAGTYNYVCTLHFGMNGKIVVR